MPTDPDAPPPIPPGIDAAHLHFTRSRVQVGDLAPEFELPVVDGAAVGGAVAGGGTVALSSLRGRPTVLVFGSFT